MSFIRKQAKQKEKQEAIDRLNASKKNDDIPTTKTNTVNEEGKQKFVGFQFYFWLDEDYFLVLIYEILCFISWRD